MTEPQHIDLAQFLALTQLGRSTLFARMGQRQVPLSGGCAPRLQVLLAPRRRGSLDGQTPGRILERVRPRPSPRRSRHPLWTTLLPMTRLIPLFILLIVTNGLLSQQQPEFYFLHALIPELEQDALQLRDMTDEQKKALATLLAGYYFAGLSDAVQEGTINGSFKGWDGDTLVELTDGSTFRQTEYHYEYDYSYRPDVKIFVSPFSYKILVEDSDEPVEVEILNPSRIAGNLARPERFKTILAQLPRKVMRRSLNLALSLPQPDKQTAGPIGIPVYSDEKAALYEAQDGKCAACQTPLPIHLLEVDHIVSRSKGGSDDLDNLQLLSSWCNHVKGNRGMEYLMSRLKEEGITP